MILTTGCSPKTDMTCYLHLHPYRRTPSQHGMYGRLLLPAAWSQRKCFKHSAVTRRQLLMCSTKRLLTTARFAQSSRKQPPLERSSMGCGGH